MSRIQVALALLVVAASIATASAMASDTPNHSIGTHHIDRFEAIHLLQESLKTNPNDAASWIVLGELAHEVAQDLSSQDDEPYYKLSQEAYEKALTLQPKNAGLRAAVDFAREQKADAAHWDQVRKKAASSYIEVRKRELAASGFNPTVQAYSPATTPAAPTTPATPPAAVATDSAPASQPAVTYPTPVYQPYYIQGAQPYTYQQYAGGYLYTVPAYNTDGTVPGMHGAHRRRSERG